MTINRDHTHNPDSECNRWLLQTVMLEEIGNRSSDGGMASVSVIPTLALSAALGGFLISHMFPLNYTVTSTLLAEGHFVVIPVITDDFV